MAVKIALTVKIAAKNIIKALIPYGLLRIYRRYNGRKIIEYDQKDIEHKIETFKSYFLKTDTTGNDYFDINGAKLPYTFSNRDVVELTVRIFEDVFFVPFFFGDNHDKKLIDILDLYMHEGPYGYTDNEIDVTVKPNDVVIDAGAWIGDFSAYAAAKGAIVYAFEPVSSIFNILEKTAVLNDNRIIPVKKGLSNKTGISTIYILEGRGNTGSSMKMMKRYSSKIENIAITTLDEFVKVNNIDKIDFIKSDIEGEERNLLIGAYNVMRKFAPKLAICTYHYPEDAKLLEKIIMDANPKYKVKHLRHKLFAQVVS